MNRRGGRGRGRGRRVSTGPSDTAVPIAIRNLPPDPPTISPTFKRTLNVMITETSAAGTLSISATNLTTVIQSQCLGGSTAFFRYVINNVKVWGGAGDGVAVTVLDELYGISSFDVGTYSRLPRVGLYFPPSTRQIKSKDSSDNLINVSTAPDAASVTILFNLTLWTIASADF